MPSSIANPISNYAVMGHPISHSLSPWIHRAFAEQTVQAIHYEAIDISPTDFAGGLRDFALQSGRGTNVTLPFKEQAFALMRGCSERARLAKSVNTITINGVDDYFGDNTDGVGLLRDLERLNVTVARQRWLILGAGGATRGILPALLQQQPTEIVIANRTRAKAEELVATYSGLGTLAAYDYAELAQQQPFAGIIHATSAGLTGELPALPANILTPQTFCYDLMYAKTPTLFLTWAQGQGIAQLSDGLGMLVAQAAESFFIWRGVLPETSQVLTSLRDYLQGK